MTLDFECWEMELGFVLEVGWAVCYWEGGGVDGWKEMRDQGHWM